MSFIGASMLGGLLILVAFLLFRVRVYIKIDEELQTYECVNGILGFTPLHKGGFEDISHIEIHKMDEYSRYAAKVLFPVYVHFRDPINARFLIQKTSHFKQASAFAHKLSRVTQVPIIESPELQAIREEYKTAPYEQSEIDGE